MVWCVGIVCHGVVGFLMFFLMFFVSGYGCCKRKNLLWLFLVAGAVMGSVVIVFTTAVFWCKWN